MEILQKLAVLVLGLVIVGAIFWMWNGMDINGNVGIKGSVVDSIQMIFTNDNTKFGGGFQNL